MYIIHENTFQVTYFQLNVLKQKTHMPCSNRSPEVSDMAKHIDNPYITIDLAETAGGDENQRYQDALNKSMIK